MTDRMEFSKSTRAAAVKRADGYCECGCGQLIAGRSVEFHHRTPAALGGDNSLGNCMVVLYKCHLLITNARNGLQGSTKQIVAKAVRGFEKLAGIRKKRKGRPMPGSRDSKWKKGFGNKGATLR